jgi:hypothetical protein
MNTTTKIYNNLSIRQILKNLPKNMIKSHKKQYLQNCIYVFKNEAKKVNLGYCELTRDANNRLIKMYLNF